MSARSFLYVPGDRPDRLVKALDRAGDAVIADLEDAVAPAAKDAARAAVAAWLADLATPRTQVWVRVNSGDRLADDVAAVAGSQALTGIVVPKADARALRVTDATLTAGEGRRSAPEPARIAPLIETAAALLDLPRLAAAPRVSHLAIGEADLAADLGVDASDASILAPLRLQLVVVSAAFGLAPPTGPVDTAIRDLDGLAASSRRLRACGFGARSAIHPDQVPVIEAAFTPTPDEVERARRLVAAYDGGTAVDDDGRFVDEAVLRSARRIVGLAERPGR